LKENLTTEKTSYKTFKENWSHLMLFTDAKASKIHFRLLVSPQSGIR